MSIKINLGAWSSVFAVPSKIVDEGLKYSDGVKLKVLLYVLRNSDKELDDKDISKGTGVNVTDIPEALDYWVSLGVLSKVNDEYTFPESTNAEIYNKNNSLKENTDVLISDNNSLVENTPIEKEEKIEQKQRFTVTRPQKPDYVFTSQRLAVDEELALLVNEAQSTFGKTLSNSDISTLLMLKDTCGLPLDVILMLIQYCISIGKGNMRTVEKIGIGWADDGIYTLEAADNKIRQIKQTSKNFAVVSSVFGISNVGTPTKKQLEYGDKWVGEWKFSPEMLREAYERCVDTKGMMNLKYIDGILKRWHANGIRNTNDLITFEKLSSKQGDKKKPSSSIDYSKLNKLSIPDV
ncbi:MAG: DnaD domain protein [Ruminococcus sp.]|nr:DnaD domain protein [Ruminococcus sp.]